MRVMFYCQHVLGIGHWVRSSEIVRALAKHACVLFVNGGGKVDGFEVPAQVELANLPPLQTDPDFSALEAGEGSGSVEEIQEQRKQMLLSLFDRFRPDLLVTELYPFGRKRFAFELIPLLERARAAPYHTRIVCSLRDILVAKKDQAVYEERVCQIVNNYFDLILVHGDPHFQRLEETFSRVSDLKCPVRYTGYVTQIPKVDACGDFAPNRAGSENQQGPLSVLASIGSGRYRNGHLLLKSLIEAASELRDCLPHCLRIYAGPYVPAAVFAELQTLAAGQDKVTLQKYALDFQNLMQHAALSISMGGYNTIMNILSTGVRALVFPYTANDDQEQMIRARKLEERGVIGLIHPADLEPGVFSSRILEALRRPPSQIRLRLAGAETSAVMLDGLYHAPSLQRALNTEVVVP